ncbi:hypothetical protein GGR51DRAFT_470400 [Nemania sp. FL0031]|nr:hypothetical protein GGR51DRAFT_470400 [Nemania sp. FL0031]
MAFDANAFWGSSDLDALRGQTPSTFSLVNNPPNWDGVFDFKETVDPKSSLDLLQGPLPCSYEPQDEWLVDFERLEEVHSRVPAMGGPTISSPPHYNPYVFTGGTNTNNATSNGIYQPEEMRPPPSLHYYHDTFSSPQKRAFVPDDDANLTAPIPTKYPREVNSQSPIRPDATVYAPMLYDWNPTPAYGNQQAPVAHDVEKTRRELREMEQHFQAETKRRMNQVKQSRPG